jgi:hypothetical protein
MGDKGAPLDVQNCFSMFCKDMINASNCNFSIIDCLVSKHIVLILTQRYVRGVLFRLVLKEIDYDSWVVTTVTRRTSWS